MAQDAAEYGDEGRWLHRILPYAPPHKVFDGFELSSMARLSRAAHSGDTAEVRKLLQLGFDIETRDDRNRTPIYHAAGSGHAEAVGLLLEERASVQVGDDEGHLPLHAAAMHGHVEVVVRLLESPLTDVSAATCHGCTPLHFAACEGRSH
uniref:Ankyrin repeat protein n=1 Tax=Alexandrium monilatum TaxID=311494 RepID=A0A7S4Q8F5_9DINO